MSFPYSGAPASQAPADRIYVGVDLSLTSTGVAIAHGDTTTVQRVTSKGRKGATSAEQTERLVDLVERIAAAVPVTEHTRIAIEGPSFGSTGSAAHIIAGLWWLVRRYLRDDDVVIVPPGTVKKYATGSGSAQKDAVLAAVVRRYPHVDVTGNDEADALVLAAIAARIDGHPFDEVPAAHYSTLTKAVQR